jgi:hypothetical protein
MRHPLTTGSVSSAALVVACGGGHEHVGTTSAPAPPVAQQVRQALLEALRGPALPEPFQDARGPRPP